MADEKVLSRTETLVYFLMPNSWELDVAGPQGRVDPV